MTNTQLILEIIQILVSVSVPVTLAILGFILNRRLKSIDDAQWQNRKIVEKRLALYDEIAPDLNKVLCFFTWVGYWSEISPAEMIATKRKLDRTVNIYRHLLSEDFYGSYNEFIHLAFETYTGKNHDAKLKSEIENSWGDRRNAKFEWKQEYDQLFLPAKAVNRREVFSSYSDILNKLRLCIGLN